MNPISLILWNLVYRPIFNLIVILLAIPWANLWLAIIGLTLIIRLLLFKPSIQANNMQKDMIDIQPRLKELQKQYKDDPQKLGEETMKLFKQNGTNPFKGCIMLLIQIPVFFWLFYVIKDLSLNKWNISSMYSFLHPFFYQAVEHINYYFLSINLLSKWWTAGLILAIIAGILMYFQIKLTTITKPTTSSIPQIPGTPKIPDITKITNTMNTFMIVMMMVFVYTMPTGIGLYIVTSNLFSVVQLSYQYKELIKIKLKTLFNK